MAIQLIPQSQIGGNGLWGSNIGRQDLLQKISLLALIGGLREGLRAHQLEPDFSQTRILTVEQEAEISNNLVFLARRRHDPKTVAAVGIEEDENGQGMVVRVCINGDNVTRVKEGLEDLCESLMQISRRENSSDEDEKRFLIKVVGLDFPRISIRMKLPQKYSLEASPVMVVYRELRKHLGSEGRADTSEVIDTIETLAQKFPQLKKMAGHFDRPTADEILCSIIVLVYETARSAEFEALRFKENDRNRDSFLKLGQYYRATRQLVRFARRQQSRLFRNIRVHTFDIRLPSHVRAPGTLGSQTSVLECLPSSLRHQVLQKHFQGSAVRLNAAMTRRLSNAKSSIKIHAEIKLLFFYETYPGVRRPRVLTANKSSCYLCDLFIRLHGAFQVPSTYGMLNERWILPDWHPLPPGCFESLTATLQSFDDALNLQVEKCLLRRQKIPDPLESLIAFSATWSESQVSLTIRSTSDEQRSNCALWKPSFQFSPTTEEPLEIGKEVCRPLQGRSPSLFLHFWEDHATLSIRTTAPEVAASSVVRVLVTPYSDEYGTQPGPNCDYLIQLRDLSPTRERNICRRANGESRVSICWNRLCILITFDNIANTAPRYS